MTALQRAQEAMSLSERTDKANIEQMRKANAQIWAVLAIAEALDRIASVLEAESDRGSLQESVAIFGGTQ
jgi:hypothetical protein